MPLPVKTIIEDIDSVCTFLGRKPTGATVKEAKAVIDSKHLDARKLAALRGWNFIEDSGEKMKLASRGREYIRGGVDERRAILLQIVQSCPPYSAVVERAAHRREESISTVDVGSTGMIIFLATPGKRTRLSMIKRLRSSTLLRVLV